MSGLAVRTTQLYPKPMLYYLSIFWLSNNSLRRVGEVCELLRANGCKWKSNDGKLSKGHANLSCYKDAGDRRSLLLIGEGVLLVGVEFVKMFQNGGEIIRFMQFTRLY